MLYGVLCEISCSFVTQQTQTHKNLIILFTFFEMHLYNRSGINHKRVLQRLNKRGNKNRRAFTTVEKMKILSIVEKMVEESTLSYAQASTAIGMDQSLISRWKKNQEKLAAVTRPGALSLHSGPVSILKDIEGPLINFVDEWRGKGLPVNRVTLMRKAFSLKPELNQKSEHAAKMCISRFMKNNGLTHCMATHKAQWHPSEVESEALQFLDVIRPILLEQNRDLDYVLNMDQTPVYHAMDFRGTIDRVGARTINLRTSASDSKRVTVAVTVTASGKKVKSMVVFKGEYLRELYHISHLIQFGLLSYH